jgi:multicomponent Na+:H+ antiporter subunit A
MAIGAAADPGHGRFAHVIAVLASLAGFAGAVALLPGVAAGTPVRFAWPWVPSLSVELAFRIDGLALLFVLLICGTGFFVSLYAGAYLANHARRGRFFAYLLLFEFAMLGLVTADDLFLLFVFWELTTVASYLLIGFDHESETARRNAWQALLVTGAGGLALLAGLLLLADAGDSGQLGRLIERGALIREHPQYRAILVLVLAGAFTKSAQVPFHLWLPNAMAAPTPVSAFLHSATMVKAGIYLLARLHPVLADTGEWIWTLTLVGAATAVWSAIVAIRQTDLKLALAYTTVMALGTLTMFLGAESPVAIAAAVTFLVVHALYKCGLFLVVGIIDHATGTRDTERLRGLARAMPITAAAAAVAALSMAGSPPFLGFIGKELKYEGALAVASEPALVAAAALVANSLLVAVAGIVAVRPFVGWLAATATTAHDPPFRMWVGPVFLAALGLVFGMLPPFPGELLVEPAVAAIVGAPVTVKLALWHGINVPLLLSVLTFTAGLGIYRYHRSLRRLLDRVLHRLPLTADRAYDHIVEAVLALAKAQTRWLQSGSLRRYLLVVTGTTTVVLAATLVAGEALTWPTNWPAIAPYEWGIVVLVAAGALLPVVTDSRLAAICGLGVVGAGVALLFLLYGAVDVAMTQLLVEILFVVMIAIILLRLPRVPQTGERGFRQGLHWLVAGGAGLTVTLLLWSILETPFRRELTAYFEANSVPLGRGRNIVNVILVDFRALDTLGEIAVVGVAAIGAAVVLRPHRSKEPDR